MGRRGLAPLVAALLAIGGCGSGASPKTAFVGGANVVCKGEEADLTRISAQLRALKLKDPKQLYARAATLTHEAAAREKRAAQDLSALKAPAADATAIGRWLDGVRGQADLTEQAATLLTAQNPRGAAPPRPCTGSSRPKTSRTRLPTCTECAPAARRQAPDRAR